ncbi:MAG: hypothetical protein ABTQ28_16470, partial [Thauera sp.]
MVSRSGGRVAKRGRSLAVTIPSLAELHTLANHHRMQSSLKLHYADHFVLPLPEGHRFPMEKYSRLRARLRDSGLFADET